MRNSLKLARGLGQMMALMLGCTLLVFILQAVSGRNPARAILGVEASQDSVEALNEELGLNKSIIAQYFDFLTGILQGDLGISFYSASPVAELLSERIWATGLLLIMGLTLSLLISVPLTMLSVRRPHGIANTVVRVFTIAGTVMPAFWVGILLILLVALPTGLFPVGGFGSSFIDQLRALILPSLTMAIGLAPVQIRTLRSSWLVEMASPYVEAAQARGVTEGNLLLKHAFPNSVTPLISIIAVQAGWSIFTAVIVENTFRIPGLGQGLVLAANQADLPVVNATTLLLAFTVIFVSFVSDWLVQLFDPRLRAA